MIGAVVGDQKGAIRVTVAAPAGSPHPFGAWLRPGHPMPAQLTRFALVGGLGTVLNALLFLLLRNWWEAMAANLVALVLSTVASTEANRWFTFDDARRDPFRARLQIVATVAFYAFYNSAVLVLLDLVVENPTAVEQSVTVVVAGVLGGLVRFLVLRDWVFRDRRDHAERAGRPGRHGRRATHRVHCLPRSSPP